MPAAKDLDVLILSAYVPDLLEQISSALRSSAEAAIAPVQFGEGLQARNSQKLDSAADIVEIVAEFSVLRTVIKEVVAENDLILYGPAAEVIDRTIDAAIGAAIHLYSVQRSLDLQRRREEHISFLMHDLKTPLAALYTAATIVEAKLTSQNPEAVQPMLQIVLRNANRLHTLLSGVLQDQANLMTTESFRPECREIDLWPVVQRLVDDVKPLADAAHSRTVNDVPADVVAYADGALLGRALQNLIGNAIEHTKDGEIRISAKTLPNMGIECRVTDTGAGIPEDRVGKVFDRLETDPEKHGLGLGLAIVREIVEAHGGSIDVESTLGRGTTFRFVLPGVGSSGDADRSSSSQAHRAGSGS